MDRKEKYRVILEELDKTFELPSYEDYMPDYMTHILKQVKKNHKIIPNSLLMSEDFSFLRSENYRRLQALSNSVFWQEKIYPLINMIKQMPQQPAYLTELLQKISNHKAKIAILTLLDNGWYFDSEMSNNQLIELANKIDDGDVHGAEDLLCVHFKNQMSRIESEVIATFPARKDILSEAFHVMRAGHYSAAIVLFLSQAEGMAHEHTNIKIYSKNGNNAIIKEIIEQYKNDTAISNAVMVLGRVSPMNVSEKGRAKDFDGLNRHQVLHGEVFNYGTELNFYRAISMIVYITRSLALIKM